MGATGIEPVTDIAKGLMGGILVVLPLNYAPLVGLFNPLLRFIYMAVYVLACAVTATKRKRCVKESNLQAITG